jgi:hypothetical protein
VVVGPVVAVVVVGVVVVGVGVGSVVVGVVVLVEGVVVEEDVSPEGEVPSAIAGKGKATTKNRAMELKINLLHARMILAIRTPLNLDCLICLVWLKACPIRAFGQASPP